MEGKFCREERGTCLDIMLEFQCPSFLLPIFILFSGIHIRALRGSEAAKCRSDPLAALKTAIRRAEDELHLYAEEHIRVPGLSQVAFIITF